MIFDAADLGELAELLEAAAGRVGAGSAAGEVTATAAPPLLRRPADSDPIPASFAQERLWFMDQLAPGTAAYNLAAALRIQGPVRPATLAAALGEVVRRHEILRTSLRNAGGKPVQAIAPRPAPGAHHLPLIDLAALPPPARAVEERRVAQREADRPFDLACGPLLRTLLLRAGAEDHVLVLNTHHVASDGWSAGVLVQEVGTLWQAAETDGGGRWPAGIPPDLPVQYADFAVWQRAWLQGGALASQEAYWRRQLAGAPTALALPADRPRPAAQKVTVAPTRTARFGRPLTERLRQLALAADATLYMVLLGGLQALLGRLAGQQDLIVGSPIANRERAEIEPLIGYFVNNLAMRADLSGDPSWSEWLGRCRHTALDAYAHQDLPFERLVEVLRPPRHLALTLALPGGLRHAEQRPRPASRCRTCACNRSRSPRRRRATTSRCTPGRGRTRCPSSSPTAPTSSTRRPFIAWSATSKRSWTPQRPTPDAASRRCPSSRRETPRQVLRERAPTDSCRRPGRPPSAPLHTPPRTAAEALLAALWRELLGVEDVAVEDHFFALGGHSLLATQLVFRLREAHGLDLPLKRIFERPTLEELAAALDAAEHG